jgi:ribose 5-phosphate isomerase
MALSQKAVKKSEKNAELIPFDRESMFTTLQEILTRECLEKKKKKICPPITDRGRLIHDSDFIEPENG